MSQVLSYSWLQSGRRLVSFKNRMVALSVRYPCCIHQRPLTTTTTTTPTVSSNSSSTQHQQQQQQQRPRRDPMAKRPNAKCDPYGQGGKRMSNVQVQQLLTTLHDDWQVIVQDKENGIDNTDDSHNQDQSLLPIVAIQRQFVHDDFLAGAHFVQKVAAVGVMHNHYPLSIELTRRIVQQQWQTCTYITCQTRVLEGLSTHDFHFAMMLDVEVERPDVQALIRQEST